MSDCKWIFVVGGAASGKSAWAEGACAKAGSRLLYVATMEPHGQDADARIEKHKAMRRGKGFQTLERARDLSGAVLAGRYDAILLEDTGNLMANEQFGGGGELDRIVPAILEGLDHLSRHTGTLVIVGNHVFSGAQEFTGEMADYLRLLGQLHAEIAGRSHVVVESVCGIPVYQKGGQQA